VAAGAILVLAPASRACAEQPGPCVQRVWAVVASKNSAANSASPPLVAVLPVATVADPPPVPEPDRPSVPAQRNFKESGSSAAPVCVEIYVDFDCPHCASFVRDVAPLLADQFVRTGKVRLLYRDYPLPTHRFAKLAARYADAAGQLGYYDIAMKQIFDTRQTWDENGDVDSQVALVLPPDVMAKLREHLSGDPKMDDIIAADLAAGQEDHLDRTPFAVIGYEGKRQAITDAPLSFEVLKNRIDELMETRT
jgi:protein-disulfide isomerase